MSRDGSNSSDLHEVRGRSRTERVLRHPGPPPLSPGPPLPPPPEPLVPDPVDDEPPPSEPAPSELPPGEPLEDAPPPSLGAPDVPCKGDDGPSVSPSDPGEPPPDAEGPGPPPPALEPGVLPLWVPEGPGPPPDPPSPGLASLPDVDVPVSPDVPLPLPPRPSPGVPPTDRGWVLPPRTPRPDSAPDLAGPLARASSARSTSWSAASFTEARSAGSSLDRAACNAVRSRAMAPSSPYPRAAASVAIAPRAVFKAGEGTGSPRLTATVRNGPGNVSVPTAAAAALLVAKTTTTAAAATGWRTREARFRRGVRRGMIGATGSVSTSNRRSRARSAGEGDAGGGRQGSSQRRHEVGVIESRHRSTSVSK